jgi:SAM-dependent methyltransferase
MNWFESWFDSPWYPILYAQRDEQEASEFIEKIVVSLNLPPASSVLDLACGRGRHARCMASLGMKVTGVDLSEMSLTYARSIPLPNLSYVRHDMRQPLNTQAFDAVFNLFTSFGYFDDPEDDLKVIRAARSSLRSGGYFVIDYLNPSVVLPFLPTQEDVERSGVLFQVKRYYKAPWIFKDIVVLVQGVSHHYQEKVRCYSAPELAEILGASGLNIIQQWGDYQLNPPHAQSPRTIFICQNPISTSN